jgi:hypothetical protein
MNEQIIHLYNSTDGNHYIKYNGSDMNGVEISGFGNDSKRVFRVVSQHPNGGELFSAYNDKVDIKKKTSITGNLDLNNNYLTNSLYGNFIYVGQSTFLNGLFGQDKSINYYGITYQISGSVVYYNTGTSSSTDYDSYIYNVNSTVFKVLSYDLASGTNGYIRLSPCIHNDNIHEFSCDICCRPPMGGAGSDEIRIDLFANNSDNGLITLNMRGHENKLYMGGIAAASIINVDSSYTFPIQDEFYYNLKIKINNNKVSLLINDKIVVQSSTTFKDIDYNLSGYINNTDYDRIRIYCRGGGAKMNIYVKNIKFKSGALQCEPIQDLHANSIDSPGFRYDNTTGITYVGFSSTQNNRKLRDHGTVGTHLTSPTMLSVLKICNRAGPHDSGWHIGTQAETPSATDNDLYFGVQLSDKDTKVVSFIQDGYTTAVQMNFTGQHRCVPEDNDLIDNIDNYIGMVVESTGNYDTLLNINDNIETRSIPTINESQPIVTLTTIRKSKKVYGVISDKEVLKNGCRTFGSTFVSLIYGLKEQETPRLFINSLGEGGIKVCNENGNIENGDLLCSSSIPGIAMKQDDDLLRNYTVGKSTMDYNFIDNNDYKLIGCVYYCG